MTEMDWEALSLPDVDDIARQVAGRIARDYEYVIERDDAYQEALIILAGRRFGTRELWEKGDLGMIQYRLDRDMVNLLVTQSKHRKKHVSVEALLEGTE